MQITRTDSLADSGKILKESIIRELYEDAERQLKETLSAHQRELFEKFGSVKNVGVEDTPRISEPLSFFEKTLFSSAPTGVSHR